MPGRKTAIQTDYYYHIFNRSINKEPIFTYKKCCHRAVSALEYYQHKNPPVKMSIYLSQGVDRQQDYNKLLYQSKRMVDIIAYCLMPNHYHLILKQLEDNGIRKFISLFQNSYTRYFNTKFKRNGHLFQGKYKAVYVEEDDQLLHLMRYIHLNPFTSSVVETKEEILNYPYSSLSEYLSNSNGLCQKDIIRSFFKTKKTLLKFILDRADYQRNIEEIKHLTFEHKG